MEEYSLEKLQELRDEYPTERLKYQRLIDSYFFQKGQKTEKKRKRKLKFKNEDDIWWQ